METKQMRRLPAINEKKRMVGFDCRELSVSRVYSNRRCLMSYDTKLDRENLSQAGNYTGRILKDAKQSDLPVMH
jgi:hypothetical protein